MEQEKQTNFPEEYKRVSIDYCSRMREYIDSVEAEIKKASENLNMNNPYQADGLRSFTWGLVREVKEKITGIGERYQYDVCDLRDRVIREKEHGLE